MSMAKSLVPISFTIQAFFTATPGVMTDPPLTCKVSIPNQPFNDHGILQKRMHIVLCYKKIGDEDLGWHLGGWIKETLGRALIKAPILAGRLRRLEDGGFKIVSNNSGVRCLEAQTSQSLVEFLESKDKREIEAELVYWKDVDETNPHFSPLFYVQVTNFQCGGYTVGISCSLLLADPLLIGKLLNEWADIHQSIAYAGENPKVPVFYLPDFRQIGYSPPAFATNISNLSAKSSKTAMFSISIHEKLNSEDEGCKGLVLLCIQEAESKLGSRMSLNFTLITKEPNGDAIVEIFSKQSILGSQKGLRYELSPLSWEDLRTNEIAFLPEDVPIDVSHWVACDALGVVLVVFSFPCEGKSDMHIFVTVPSERD